MDAKHGLLHFPQMCAANDAWSGCGVKCQLFVYETELHIFEESVYIFLLQQSSSDLQ